MKLPPFIIAAALLLWAERAAQWPVALPLAAVVELAHWVPWRWKLQRRDFDRVADASAVGLVLVAIYAFDEYAFHGVYRLLEWLPMLMFPLLLVQVYSTETEIRYTSLFFSMRRAHAKGLVSGQQGVDFRRPYLGGCLLAATVNTEDGGYVFWVLLAILGWLLWCNRSPRYSARTWLIALLVLGALAMAARAGMIGVRRIVEPAVVAWFQDRIWSHRDPFRAYTAIGHIGRLKQSDAVVLRVTPEPQTGRVPSLLREAVYQSFSRNIWLAGNANFEAISSDLEGTTWKFREPLGASHTVRIGVYLPRGRGMLPLPSGAWQMTSLPAEEVERNPLGALRVADGPDFAEFDAHFVDLNNYDEPPAEADLRVPGDLGALMNQVLGTIGVTGLTPVEAALRIQSYFDQGFTYSVVLKRPTAVSNPIHGFLLETRSGHCEYYATATVMLLRAAGVPARYVSGYSVQEWSPVEERYLVRRRHAHSWVSAWLDGAWREIDTTPSVWVADEGDDAPWWEPAYDWLSWVWFQYSRWRWQVETEDEGNDLLWLVLPLALILAWRLRRSERVPRTWGRRRESRPPSPGADSEFYLVEARLTGEGLARGEGEPLAAWLQRLSREGRLAESAALLDEALPLHYRYRFDPRGLAPSERARLRASALAWLSRTAGET